LGTRGVTGLFARRSVANPVKEFERKQLSVIEDQQLYGTDEGEWLSQSAEEWERSVELLVELGMLEEDIPPSNIMVGN
jgi:hypothetical protein